ncbi:NAD(P)-binding domain-containing protein [Dyadobacter sp. CY261]|uniref:NADPH-dependent F420 reductase n=1 Tax=Dyadobacter sp. CY261 TaxID=2907203 RepID=UPI001F3F4DDA|nr:NAD(P)-binding domain-containing protein [Dyadobacter sp. CY261]MCF0074242.1 NAD(P)-binding domain-containing protein [Dyadobacter sp. CY261]
MNIGIIGSGEMGACLASGLNKLGHRVSIANSRGPASLAKIAQATGAEPVEVEQAIKNKEVIVISIPSKNIPDLPKALFSELKKDVVVIDTTNYYPQLRDGILPELEQSWIDSLWVQQQLNVPIVKVFNSILATSLQVLGRPKGHAERIALAISGDSAHGKTIASELVDQLGFDPVDSGAISQSWKLQPGSPVYCRDIGVLEMSNRLESLNGDWSVLSKVILPKRQADEALMGLNYPAYLESLI